MTRTEPINPIINNPYVEPSAHWKLNADFRTTNEKQEGRRPSGAWMSVPTTSSERGGESITDRDPHPRINEIRWHVREWRASGYLGASRVTRELLEFWRGDSIEPKPFFCQVEALETLIWLIEAGPELNSPEWEDIRCQLDELNETWNEKIARLAIKMATGTGKTLVMAMIIVWLVLSRERRTDFLIICPNRTVRKRLGELDPSLGSTGTEDLYRSLVPPGKVFPIGQLNITVLNFQAFQRRDVLGIETGKTATGVARRLIRREGDDERWKEQPTEMMARLLKSHASAKEIFVLNDEAHHCYKRVDMAGRADAESKKYEEHAELWFNALRILRQENRLVRVFDLSATPMFLRRPRILEHDLFPWTVSDYPLIEAVEAGLTKIPRVPVEDDTNREGLLARDIWNVIDSTDRKELENGNIPQKVSGLISTLYENYQQLDAKYTEVGMTPVMILVAKDINLANALYKHITGRNGLAMFRNVDTSGDVVTHPPTLLVHSDLDEGGSGGVAKSVRELQKKAFPAPKCTNQTEWLREIFHTVGQKGKPGEHIRCVVSVSMLTEGWDARTVTHIFGLRAFKSQLLCEQVAGRALRRTSFTFDGPNDLLDPQYAEIFGVPFSFMRGGKEGRLREAQPPWRVSTVDGRMDYRLHFPNIVAYRIEHPNMCCMLDEDDVEQFEIMDTGVPDSTVISGTIGDELELRPLQHGQAHAVYKLAKCAMDLFASDYGKEQERPLRRTVLFASMVNSVRKWLKLAGVEQSRYSQIIIEPNLTRAAQSIARTCVPDTDVPKIVPVFRNEQDPAQPRSFDTAIVDFETRLKRNNRYPPNIDENAKHSELNAAACHSGGEARVAEALEENSEIGAWVRNFRLGWNIPYFANDRGVWRFYEPDFVARLAKRGPDDEDRYLVIEYKGVPDEDAANKQQEVEDWWIPAVNGSSDSACYGHWKYVFIKSSDNINHALLNAVKELDA